MFRATPFADILPDLDGHGIVVGFIGAHAHISAPHTATNALIGCNAFSPLHHQQYNRCDTNTHDTTCKLEAFRIKNSSPMYMLLTHYGSLEDHCFLRTMLLVFNICHHILFIEPSPHVSLQTISLLRRLQCWNSTFHSNPESELISDPPSLCFVFPSTEQDDANFFWTDTESLHLTTRLTSHCQILLGHQRVVDDRAPLYISTLEYNAIILPPELNLPIALRRNESTSFSKCIKSMQSVFTQRMEQVAENLNTSAQGLPSLHEWKSLAKTMIAAVNTNEGFAAPMNERSFINADEQFWIVHTKQAVEDCVDDFLVDIPDTFSVETHRARVEKTLCTLRRKVPNVSSEIVSQLSSKLDSIWSSAHRLCDAVSVQGSRCNLPFHESSTHQKSGISINRVCRCGRQLASFNDTFTVADANRCFLSCCERSLLELDFGVSGWSVHCLESTSYLDPLQPLDDIKGIEGQALLQKWQVSGHDVAVYVAFEYGCLNGHRSFISLNEHTRLSYIRNQSSLIGDHLPASDLHLFLACKACSDKTSLSSRLNRIFIMTPNSASHLMFCPFITWQSGVEQPYEQDCSNFGPGRSVILPPDSLLSIALPFVLSLDGQHPFQLDKTSKNSLVLAAACLYMTN